jgi:Bacterial type II and III secretion system protein
MLRLIMVPVMSCLVTLVTMLTNATSVAQFNAESVKQLGAGSSISESATNVAPTDEPKEAISLSVWILTLAESATEESTALAANEQSGDLTEELSDKLHDKANNLPAVVGTREDVRALIGRLKVAGLLQKSREVRIQTLNGQTAVAQMGTDQPSITATQINDRGTTNNIMMRSVGTIVSVTPRIDTEGAIQVGFEYNSTRLEQSTDIALAEFEGHKPMMASFTVNQQSTTVVRLKSGSAVLVWSDATRESDGSETGGETQMIILAAEVVPSAEQGG